MVVISAQEKTDVHVERGPPKRYSVARPSASKDLENTSNTVSELPLQGACKPMGGKNRVDSSLC